MSAQKCQVHANMPMQMEVSLAATTICNDLWRFLLNPSVSNKVAVVMALQKYQLAVEKRG